jgi:hypothetical protein
MLLSKTSEKIGSLPLLGYTNVGAGRLQLVEDDDELLNDIRGYVKNHGDDSNSVKRSRSS